MTNSLLVYSGISSTPWTWCEFYSLICSVVGNCEISTSSWPSVNDWLNKFMFYLYPGILCCYLKEWALSRCANMGKCSKFHLDKEKQSGDRTSNTIPCVKKNYTNKCGLCSCAWCSPIHPFIHSRNIDEACSVYQVLHKNPYLHGIYTPVQETDNKQEK